MSPAARAAPRLSPPACLPSLLVRYERTVRIRMYQYVPLCTRNVSCFMYYLGRGSCQKDSSPPDCVGPLLNVKIRINHYLLMIIHSNLRGDGRSVRPRHRTTIATHNIMHVIVRSCYIDFQILPCIVPGILYSYTCMCSTGV